VPKVKGVLLINAVHYKNWNNHQSYDAQGTGDEEAPNYDTLFPLFLFLGIQVF
jgi:hypothetical protein